MPLWFPYLPASTVLSFKIKKNNKIKNFMLIETLILLKKHQVLIDRPCIVHVECYFKLEKNSTINLNAFTKIILSLLFNDLNCIFLLFLQN